MDYSEAWSGISDKDVAFVQLKTKDHGDDTDDVVPQFSYAARDAKPQSLKVKRTKTGFDGQEYEEFFDE
jgi:hypothetical protein